MSDDFGDVAKEFQGICAPSGDLARAVEKGRKKLGRGIFIGVVIAMVTSSAGIFVLWKLHNAASVVFAAIQIGLPIAVLAFAAYSQRHAWQAHSQTTRGFLELELERSRDRIRKMRFVRWSLPVLAAMVVLFHVLIIREIPGLWVWNFSAVNGLAGPYVIAAFLLWLSLRKQAQFEREEAELMRQIAELDVDVTL